MAKFRVEEAQPQLLNAQQSVRPILFSVMIKVLPEFKQTNEGTTTGKERGRKKCGVMDSLDASKPPEGAGVPLAGSGTAADAAEAGRGAVGDGRVPIVSKPVSRRSFCTGAGVRDGAAVGARVGDINPEWGATHTQ